MGNKNSACRYVLAEARRRSFKVVVSVAVAVECHNPRAYDLLMELSGDRRITIQELTLPIVDKARKIDKELHNKFGISVGQWDLINLASAIYTECDTFVTVDGLQSEYIEGEINETKGILHFREYFSKEYGLRICLPWLPEPDPQQIIPSETVAVDGAIETEDLNLGDSSS